MILARLEFTNYACFRGVHELALEAKAYAVTARREDDPDGSNWCGKSTLLRAVPLLLFGAHEYALEDGWITDGEQEGEVRGRLVDGPDRVTVFRSRVRGKATKLRVVEEHGHTLVGDAAQEWIVRRIGLGQQDFDASSFLAQKKMARFTTIQPAKFSELVAEWLRLGPLRACEAQVLDELAAAGKRQADAQKRHDEFAAKLAEWDQQNPGTGTDLWQRAHLLAAYAEEDVAQKRGVLERLREKKEAHLLAQRDAEDSVSYEAAVRDGIMHARVTRGVDVKAHDAVLKDAIDEHSQATARLRSAEESLRSRAMVKRGEFDGACPLAEVKCPARAQINTVTTRILKLFDSAGEAVANARAEVAKVKATVDATTAKNRELHDSLTRAEELRKRALELKPAADRHAAREGKGGAFSGPEIAMAAGELNGAETKQRLLNAAASSIADWTKQRDACAMLRDKAAAEMSLLRLAHGIFGRAGAQRKIAEGALSEVEQLGNSALAQCGIDVGFRVTWGREGKDPASHCGQCGSAFPASAKVKACPRCAAPRGRNFVDRLDLSPTRQSDGAAADLVGLAFQVAAGAWLRRERCSAWSVAAVDEPYGALDQTNLRQLAGNMARLLRACGFEQAFVISHSPGANEALPGRIEVVAGPDGSTVSVL